MAQPDEIKNGDIPDAEVLMTWLYWLAAGKGIKTGTFDELKAAAAANPSESFDCWATDIKQRLFYTGDTANGIGGFISLGGGTPSNTEEAG